MSEKINDLEKFRAQIDIIDQTILELIGKRQSISTSIGVVKKNLKIAVCNKEREKELIGRLKEKGKNLNLSEKCIEEVWSNLLKESKKMQRSGL